MGPVLRNKNRNQNRTGKGRYQTKCESSLHNDVVSHEANLIFLQGRDKGIGKCKFKQLVDNGILKPWTKHICQMCFHKFADKKASEDLEEQINVFVDSNQQHIEEDNLDVEKGFEDGHLLEGFENIRCENSGNNDLLTSCENIGMQLAALVKADVKALYNDKSKLSIEKLLEYNCHDWLNKRPPELVTLLRYICNFKDQHLTSDPSLEFALARTVQQIYSLTNKNLVLSLSFKKNILTYKLTHSKQLINYNARLTAAGSYTYLTDWLTNQAASPIQVPGGLIRNLMDNEQVVGKNRLITADNKVPVSVITSHAHILIDKESDVQKTVDSN